VQYTFIRIDNNERVLKTLTVSEYEALLKEDEETYLVEVGDELVPCTRDIIGDLSSTLSVVPSGEMRSIALGVPPSQVEDAQREAAAVGVPTEYDPRTGEAIFTSRGHRKRLCEKLGYFDRDAGYGDPAPKNG
jgi:hypothetical protein